MLNYKKSSIERRNMYGTENVKQITEMERKKHLKVRHILILMVMPD